MSLTTKTEIMSQFLSSFAAGIQLVYFMNLFIKFYYSCAIIGKEDFDGATITERIVGIETSNGHYGHNPLLVASYKITFATLIIIAIISFLSNVVKCDLCMKLTLTTTGWLIVINICITLYIWLEEIPLIDLNCNKEPERAFGTQILLGVSIVLLHTASSGLHFYLARTQYYEIPPAAAVGEPRPVYIIERALDNEEFELESRDRSRIENYTMNGNENDIIHNRL